MYGTYTVSLAGLVLHRIFCGDSDLFLGAKIFPLSLGLFFHHWRFPFSSFLSLFLYFLCSRLPSSFYANSFLSFPF
jgi:hypothetical protein